MSLVRGRWFGVGGSGSVGWGWWFGVGGLGPVVRGRWFGADGLGSVVLLRCEPEADLGSVAGGRSLLVSLVVSLVLRRTGCS